MSKEKFSQCIKTFIENRILNQKVKKNLSCQKDAYPLIPMYLYKYMYTLNIDILPYVYNK